MLRSNRTHRKLDPLFLLALAVSLAAIMTTAVSAGEVRGFSAQGLASSSGFAMTPLDHTGAGLYLSLQTPAEVTAGFIASGSRAQEIKALPSVFLSFRMPW